ncbi:MAG: crossover junction endodeoxyribonuclease RuvC [Patescibacteria group bacterium]
MKILGIDPGSSRIGYGLIEKTGQKLKLIRADTLEIKEKDPNQKLLYLAADFKKLLEECKPDLLGIEKIFFYKNVKTAIEVAQARGVLVLLTLQRGIPLVEFTPQKVKKATTNYGSADKQAVAKMVSLLLNEPQTKRLDDTTDAIAIAITAANNY